MFFRSNSFPLLWTKNWSEDSLTPNDLAPQRYFDRSTAATIVERPDGSLYIALGGSGGSRIFGAVAQVLLNVEWGMDISAAVEAPRLHDQLFPAMVTIESGGCLVCCWRLLERWMVLISRSVFFGFSGI